MGLRSVFLRFWGSHRYSRLRMGAPLPSQVNAYCLTLTQGFVLNTVRVPELRRGKRLSRLTPFGVAIISQTCDIVQPKSSAVVVGAIVDLDPVVAKEARSGARPRYAHLPALGDSKFVDLDHLATIHKTRILELSAREGISQSDDTGQRAFSHAVGRRFSRYAFPDEVVPWLSPLRSVVQGTASKPNSPLALAIASVEELRVQSTGWASKSQDLTLHVIVNALELPELGDEPAVPSKELLSQFNVPRTPKEIAAFLFPAKGPRPVGDDRQFLWAEFGDALADQCKAKERDLQATPSARDAVRSVESIVSSEDDFTLGQFRKSERLDLAHLSLPRPHDN